MVQVRYGELPEPTTADDRFGLRLPTDAERSAAHLVASLERPGVVRDALLAMGDVLASDLSYRSSDRSDYLAYLLSKGKGVSQELWNAQKDYLQSRYGAQAEEVSPLDPVLTVDRTGLALEVFSGDESAYARLHLRAGEAYRVEQEQAGTTHLDVRPRMLEAIGRMRSYRAATLELGALDGGQARALRVPYRWIRAFGQVQAASTLPSQRFEIAPVDLYNVLFSLRMHRARKGPRALRYELVPGEVPKMVLEPWDVVLPCTGGVYQGSRPQVVRTWGRKRLLVLARLLPHAQRVSVHLVGAGLPAYYAIELGDASVSLALSGWTDSGWAGIATFDLLAAGETDDILPRQILAELDKGPRSHDALSQACGRERGEVRQAVLSLMQQGRALYDLGSATFVRRDLFAEPPPAKALRYRDEREAEAHRLLEIEGQVKLTRVHDLGGEGVRIEGEVEDRQAHRSYSTSFTLDREGRTVDASCTSPQFRRSGLREGPTVPMIALRLFYARQQAELERARGTAEGRKRIQAETRTLIRRADDAASIYRLSLDDRQVVLRWGAHPDAMRMQRLFFGSADEAREEYFGRLERLAERGFIDASAAEAV
ncbi:MAG: hypothetical protein JXR96_11730 [Deltaproteobacteria bacterium]|nr:hypothetical protein [Deltaproteobacteria bacterium]